MVCIGENSLSPGAFAMSERFGFYLVLTFCLTAVVAIVDCQACCNADEHQHDHGVGEVIERPKIFLDKSPRIVEYQLKRLDNKRLLLVERGDDDVKYAPVHEAILRRPGMALQPREQAAAALASIRSTSVVQELLTALRSLDPADRDQLMVSRQLSEMLSNQPAELLAEDSKALELAANDPHSAVCAAGMAALMMTGQANRAWELAGRDEISRIAWLSAVATIPGQEVRVSQRQNVLELLGESVSRTVRINALPVLAAIPDRQAESFERIAAFVDDQVFQDAAVKALLEIPPVEKSESTSQRLAELLVLQAERTAAANRTTDAFIDTMVLAEQLLTRLQPAAAQLLRERMRAVSVRVVRIKTVHEEMRYDVPFFAVEAGRPVQVVLQNEDLMPHNLVFTRTGTLQAVAMAGAELGPNAGFHGLPYVPESEDVLFATDMVEAGKQIRLTFDAPSQPGEYPYVCTFPRHWMRMYGVMIVVDDLDAWQRQPTPPQDPLGNTRNFVNSWALSDFAGDLSLDVAERSLADGQRLFKEATCLQCHKLKGEGGAVGPELTDVLIRWKNDYHGVLREILEPSYRVDPKYVVQVVVLKDGKTLSGIVQSEDSRSISLLVNPETPEPLVILKSDIDEVIASSASMMPRALLDKFTRDEVLKILNYVTASE